MKQFCHEKTYYLFKTVLFPQSCSSQPLGNSWEKKRCIPSMFVNTFCTELPAFSLNAFQFHFWFDFSKLCFYVVFSKLFSVQFPKLVVLFLLCPTAKYCVFWTPNSFGMSILSPSESKFFKRTTELSDKVLKLWPLTSLSYRMTFSSTIERHKIWSFR